MVPALKQKFQTWLFRHQIESGTAMLTQRRIFILPTRQGMALAGVLVLMLIGDINYNLSLGYALTFLLATVAVISMLHAFRNMVRLQVRSGHPEEVFAGDLAQFVFHFHNDSDLPRYQLTLGDQAGHAVTFDIPARQSATVRLPIPAAKRGWLHCGRLTLSTRFPLGLFRAWSYLHFDTPCLVYPKPAAAAPLPFGRAEDQEGASSTTGDEDFSGLRDYAAGDPMPRIAWKALAREQGLQIKQFSSPLGQQLWLDWAQLSYQSVEYRLAVLTRWVLDADAQSLPYGLRLPGVEFPPLRTAAHRSECLRALALFDK